MTEVHDFKTYSESHFDSETFSGTLDYVGVGGDWEIIVEDEERRVEWEMVGTIGGIRSVIRSHGMRSETLRDKGDERTNRKSGWSPEISLR